MIINFTKYNADDLSKVKKKIIDYKAQTNIACDVDGKQKNHLEKS